MLSKKVAVFVWGDPRTVEGVVEIGGYLGAEVADRC